MQTQAIIVMGVSGSGKSTVGEKLAQELGWIFFDADDYHPPENVAKMAAGNPLNDDDRAPWLAILHDLINVHIRASRPMVLACSALKQTYRDQLVDGNPTTEIVYLHGTFELIWERMQAREGHWMRPDMLHSQFATLEEPVAAIAIPVDLSTEEQAQYIVQELN
ncbi:MAG: gluconokinase [Cellvibrionaceae bacterium]|jgi:gluconokinase